MKITNTAWYNTNQSHMIGIVMGLDEVTGEPKAYIGLGDGVDEQADINHIASNGAKLTKEMVKNISKHFEQ
jgi:hypothetical protein